MAKNNKHKKRTAPRIPKRRPIADKLIKKMRGYVGAKVVDFSAVSKAKQNAEDLQQTVATREALADHHPSHALYIYAQNQTSVVAEQLTVLPELDRLTRLVGKAEDEYLPGGPPMSPLTTSFFTCWAFFDACVGLERETLGTITMAVGRTFSMHEELIRVIGLMQDSHMAVYVHEGSEGNGIRLRELVTDRVCKAISPSGYEGRAGELWYARVLPPPVAALDEHIVFTTPYVLAKASERDWLAYFDRILPEGPPEKRVAAYAKHMKWGPERDCRYWPEFVFEAYADHRQDVIFLLGLPDVAESRPHSRGH